MAGGSNRLFVNSLEPLFVDSPKRLFVDSLEPLFVNSPERLFVVTPERRERLRRPSDRFLATSLKGVTAF